MRTVPRRRWVPFVVINALITFFGASYVWFPMGTVQQDGNQTTGALHVPREMWGSFVIVSAVAMLLVAVMAYRRGSTRAWYALCYELLFLIAVAAIEPDPVVPTLFGLILGWALWRTRPAAPATHRAAVSG